MRKGEVRKQGGGATYGACGVRCEMMTFLPTPARGFRIAHTARRRERCRKLVCIALLRDIPHYCKRQASPRMTIRYILVPGSCSSCEGRSGRGIKSRSTSRRGRQGTAVGDVGSREYPPPGRKGAPADPLRRHRRGCREPVASASSGDAAKRRGRHCHLHRATTRTEHASSCCSRAWLVKGSPGLFACCWVGSRGRVIVASSPKVVVFLVFKKRCLCSALRST